jgi:uncharacterized protein
MMKILALALVFAGMAVAVPARAAEPAAAAPAPATLAKAHELLDVMHARQVTEDAVDAQLKSIGGSIVNQLVASGQFPPAMAKDAEFRGILSRHLDRVADEARTQIRASMPQIIEIMAEVYARNFTPAQMNDMIAFYRTPTGQVVLTKLPDVAGQTSIATRDLIMGPMIRRLQEIMPQLQAELKAWADKHPAAAGEKK